MSVNFHSDPLIEEAILRARQTHPYYAGAISKLRIVADESIPTMATSAAWVTHYNSTTIAEWTIDERAAVLVHELEHLLRDHSGRMGERDPKGWNIAGDAEINQRMTGLPEGAIYPETLGMPRGMAAETYYAASGQGKPQQPQPGDGSGAGQPGQPGSGHGDAQCGSAAGGPTQAHESKDAAKPGSGARDGGQEARQEAAEQILGGRQAGSGISEELRDWAMGELGIDRSAWYHALASAVGRTLAPHGAPTRYKWPGRRDSRDIGGAMVPRWVSERPSCAVVIDTSGSITPFDLDMAKAAGHFIGRMADTVYYGCNTAVTEYGRTMPETIRGGGGTDLTVGIARAIADGAKAVVVITDCETPWPYYELNVPIIVGAVPSANVHGVPEWMTLLPIRGGDAID